MSQTGLAIVILLKSLNTLNISFKARVIFKDTKIHKIHLKIDWPIFEKFFKDIK